MTAQVISTADEWENIGYLNDTPDLTILRYSGVLLRYELEPLRGILF